MRHFQDIYAQRFFFCFVKNMNCEPRIKDLCSFYRLASKHVRSNENTRNMKDIVPRVFSRPELTYHRSNFV